MEHFEKLKELTDNLPGIPKLVDLVSSDIAANHSIIYNVEEGTSFGFNLLNRPDVSVQELFVSKGTSFPEHVHNKEEEWGLVYKGKMKVVLGDEEVILTPGSCVHFKKGVVHSSEALSDCWLIAIAIPKIQGYPE
jgi:quercetin dioxygenase-like cupin family protein